MLIVESRSKANLYKKLNGQEKKKLDSIFSRQYQKVVMNGFTVSHKKNCYQLEKMQPVTICKRDRVTIEERMDQTIKIRLRGKYLNYGSLPKKSKKINKKNSLQWVILKFTVHVPPANHPWRRINNLEYLKKSTKVSK